MSVTQLAALSAGVCVVALAAGLVGWSILLGVATIVLITLLAVIGFGDHASKRTTIATIAFGALYCLLIYLSHALNAPGEPLVMFGGFPRATAVLVYAVGPLGLLLGLLYAFSFDTEVLTEKRQKDFLDRFGNRK